MEERQKSARKTLGDPTINRFWLLSEPMRETCFQRVVIFGALLVWATGCTNVVIPYKPTISQPAPVSLLSSAYVESAETGTVSMFRVSSSGLWTPTQPPSVGTGQLPESLVVDPSGRFVYVVNARDNTISQFVIDSATSVLQPNRPALVPTGAYPQYLAIDPSGRFVYSANSNDGTVSMFAADAVNGALTPMAPAQVAAGSPASSPAGIVVDPLDRFVYCSNGDGTIAVFTINSVTGVLSPASIIAFGSGGSRGFAPAIDPAGRFLYAPEEGLNQLLVFSIDGATGQLTPASIPSYSVGMEPASVAIDPAGRYLYVVNRGDGTISQFAIESDGSLAAMPIVDDGGQPWQMLVDPSGQIAYVSNEGTASVSIYKIDSAGQLIMYGSAPAGLGAGGIGIARAQ